MPAMRRGVIAALIVAVCPSIPVIGISRAGETVVVSEGAPAAGCPSGGCRTVQRPPWHANVASSHCGPVYRPHGTMFHANPWGQLCVHQQLRETGATMPSIFPRLHTWCSEGYMPTPRPPVLPRCHNCGALIEPGL